MASDDSPAIARQVAFLATAPLAVRDHLRQVEPELMDQMLRGPVLGKQLRRLMFCPSLEAVTDDLSREDSAWLRSLFTGLGKLGGV